MSYGPVIGELAHRGAYQFASEISATQYLLAYRMFDRHVRAGASVLDWGAGEGHFSHFLGWRGDRVTAFTLCREEPFDRITSGFDNIHTVVDPEAIRALPFDDAQFDVVTSIGVLEHVRETGGTEESSLAEIRRVLKPGGVFFVYHLPNKHSWIEALAKHRPGKHHHEFRFTVNDVKRLANGAGFDVVEHRRYGILPRLMFCRVQHASPTVVARFNWIDRTLSSILPWVTQNHAVVLRTPLR